MAEENCKKRKQAPGWLRVLPGGQEAFLAPYTYDLEGYNRSRFGPIPSGSTYDDALALHGFRDLADFWLGNPCEGAAIEVYSRITAGYCEYLVFVNLPDEPQSFPEGVFVPHRPALLRLLVELEPMIRLSQTHYDRYDARRARAYAEPGAKQREAA